MRNYLAAVALCAVSVPASAATLYSNPLLNGPTASPGSSGFSANSGLVQSGQLSFNLDGFASLDGDGNCCTDVFHLAVNGVTVLELSYNLGGGGNNVIYTNLNGATVTGGDPNPGNISFAGGQLQISLPVALLAASNTFGFSYTGAAQGIGDEAWGISSVSLTGAAVPEPASWALMIAGFGLAGAAMRRRAKVQVTYA